MLDKNKGPSDGFFSANQLDTAETKPNS